MIDPLTPLFATQEAIESVWLAVVDGAAAAGLDPAKFGAAHREIVARIVDFVSAETPPPPASPAAGRLKTLFARPRPAPVSISVPPIIICGVPGTGKTTFLYVIDTVLREMFDLPDTILPEMQKGGGQTLRVAKRSFGGLQVSLLSVRKWAELLHFYAWNTAQHRLVADDLAAFIGQTLRPMRILFADEVELTGYSPTIPDLAQRGILVVGSSNQYEFTQLESRRTSPLIYRFEGEDMRAGEPREALVTPDDPAWVLFDWMTEQPVQVWERLSYQVGSSAEAVTIRLDLMSAVEAPMLETEWIAFFERVAGMAEGGYHPTIVLLDQFSLEELRTSFNGIMRFVILFDAIEQLGLGVLVRNRSGSAELSREALDHMRVTVYSARGVAEEIKERTVAGIGRATSRIGQAGHRARQLLAAE